MLYHWIEHYAHIFILLLVACQRGSLGGIKTNRRGKFEVSYGFWLRLFFAKQVHCHITSEQFPSFANLNLCVPTI